jgi:hypothetical protein
VALEEETKILAGFTSSYKLTKDLTASVNSGIDYEHVTFLDFTDPFLETNYVLMLVLMEINHNNLLEDFLLTIQHLGL